MLRWIRIVTVGAVVLTMIGVGVGVGLFLVVNSTWITINVPEWLQWVFGDRPLEVWMPAVLTGWLLAALGIGTLLLWSMFYLWRRRQYEALINRLERELATLRNLPFTHPAPLEDLPEQPDEQAARRLAGSEVERVAARAAAVDDDLDTAVDWPEPAPVQDER